MPAEPQRPKDDNPELQGEGNHTAARHYNDATKRFVEQGKVEPAAEASKPASSAEQHQMERAEEEGKSHAKGEDPALRRGSDREAG